MTGASTNPKRLTLKKTWIAWLIVWKYTPIFFFLIQPYLGPLFHFLGRSGLFLWSGSGSKTFFEPTNVDYKFLFWQCNSIYFWGWGQAQKLFETYLCRQSTSGLEVRSYLFNFDLASFRASFAIFWALRDDFFWPFDFIFFWIGIFLEPTNALEVQSYLFVLNWEKFWAFFCTFWALRAYFFGLGSGSKTFWDLPM